jgi:hypothetical protein
MKLSEKTSFHWTILGVPFHIRRFVSVVPRDYKEMEELMKYNNDHKYTQHCALLRIRH